MYIIWLLNKCVSKRMPTSDFKDFGSSSFRIYFLIFIRLNYCVTKNFVCSLGIFLHFRLKNECPFSQYSIFIFRIVVLENEMEWDF
jgi:hypothetical protein